MARNTYVQRCYEATFALWSQGERAISARAIANTLLGSTAPKVVVDETKEKLGIIARRCEEDLKLQVRPMLVRGEFFQKYHGKARMPAYDDQGNRAGWRPMSVDEARTMLAIGRANGAVGLYFPSGTDDPLQLAWLELNMASGSGKVKQNYRRTATAFEGGELSDEGALTVTDQAPRLPDALRKLETQRELNAALAPPELGDGNTDPE